MARRKRTWPEWWNWPLELTPHLEKRTEDRGFSEVDLRAMLEHAGGYRRDDVEGRWVVDATHAQQAWAVIVEPDADEKVLVVITAYPVEK
jgi:hypothetical protein